MTGQSHTVKFTCKGTPLYTSKRLHLQKKNNKTKQVKTNQFEIDIETCHLIEQFQQRIKS